MKTKMNCQEVQDKIAGMNDGWLDAAEARQTAEHIANCLRCQKEAVADKKLIAALESLKQGSVPAMTWNPSRATKGTAWSLAWLSPIAAVALVAVLWHPSAPVVVSSPPPTESAESQALDHAHMELTLFDVGSDPNRAILASFAKTTGKEPAQ